MRGIWPVSGFKVPPPLQLGFGTAILYSVDFSDYAAFFAAVERLPAFQSGQAFQGFLLAIYHTGV